MNGLHQCFLFNHILLSTPSIPYACWMASTENPPSPFTYSEFRPASKKKHRNKKWNLNHGADGAGGVKHESVNKLVLKVRDRLLGKGEEGKWFGECLSGVFLFLIVVIVLTFGIELLREAWNASQTSQTTSRCLCLGLGSPSTSNISRIQLAFLLEACSLLDIVGRFPLPSRPILTFAYA